ncbi:MAG: hypothetical protein KGO02_22950 [Alphaproteobacteria bacterium]|nr:hypothetical protein [Alphaproteobacteria bacterium]
MALQIETFKNGFGGSSLYKALSHPLAGEQAKSLIDRLENSGPVAIYDPDGIAAAFAEFYPLTRCKLVAYYVQNVEHLERRLGGLCALPVSRLNETPARVLFVASFDEARTVRQISHLIPAGVQIISFESLRVPDELISDKTRYLTTLNFATNFVFFRDQEGHHTRLVTANYWTRYGAKDVRIWCRLFDTGGRVLASWMLGCPQAEASVVIDSAEVRARFGLPEFCGQLFIHVIGAAGHDVVKYALDTYGDGPGMVSHTHDANSWPADYYAGLPAPDDNEDVVLWVQNCHPTPIAPGAISLGLMGGERTVALMTPIAPYATLRLSVSELLPQARWPQQIEIFAGKHLVRPRYEVVSPSGHWRISHPNVERVDLSPDPGICRLDEWFGKGFLLPAPVLPVARYRSLALPTPMAISQAHLPVKALLYTADGRQVSSHSFGNLRRAQSVALDLSELAEGLDERGGHVELVYDFSAGDEADGWLHALFRYQDRQSGHAAETSFGAHIFNSVLTYRTEPQSYSAPPPGLSTRLFLRITPAPFRTWCHLTYPVSKLWRAQSTTYLILTSEAGQEVARTIINIPASGSLWWAVDEQFSQAQLAAAGTNPYVIIRDETCRLFGYQGAFAPDGSFGFDHMFGF